MLGRNLRPHGLFCIPGSCLHFKNRAFLSGRCYEWLFLHLCVTIVTPLHSLTLLLRPPRSMILTRTLLIKASIQLQSQVDPG